MQLSPSYDATPIIALDGPADAIVEPFLRQRRRLLDLLGSLTETQWAAPTRCEGWSAQDVVTHLVSTDQFWGASVSLGVRGEPTRFLDGFDPNASPAQLVEAAEPAPPGATLEALREATTALCSLVEGLAPADLDQIGEAPPGHVAIPVVLHHALWDCWVHERDIRVPGDLGTDDEDDEVRSCLRYASALSPAFAVRYGVAPAEASTMGVAVTDPELTLRVEIGSSVHVSDAGAPAEAPVLRGAAVDVLEALSSRRPLVHDFGAQAWMLDGLRTVFDQV